MSLTTPLTSDLRDNLIAQLQTAFSQTIPLLPKSFLRVLAAAIAGVFVLLYKFAGFTFLQIFVQSASYTDTLVNGKLVNPLLFWGRLIGVPDPIAATNAQLLLTVTVTNQTGSLPANTQVLGAGNGVTYLTLAGVLLNAGTVPVVVIASADQAGGNGAGAIGNLNTSDVVNFANPIANVARAAVVASQVVTGADAEAIDSYRQRVIDKFQKRPQGGAYADYEEWASEAAGIINVYPYAGSPGQVDVYCEATVASSGSADGIPTTPQLTAVLALIEVDGGGRATRRPVSAFVNVHAITRTSFDVTVTGIASVGDLAQVHTDITAAMADYFASVEPYIPGLSIPPRNDIITQTRISALVEDIVTGAGGTFTSATFKLTSGGGALTIYTLTQGEKAKIGAVAFV